MRRTVPVLLLLALVSCSDRKDSLCRIRSELQRRIDSNNRFIGHYVRAQREEARECGWDSTINRYFDSAQVFLDRNYELYLKLDSINYQILQAGGAVSFHR